jgi:hypothetical protein
MKGRLRDTISAHGEDVLVVAFSPDGKLIASGSSDATVKLWNSGDGGLKATLRGNDGPVSALSWRPDGKLLLAAGTDLRMHRLSDALSVAMRSFEVDAVEASLAHTDDGLFEGESATFERVIFRVGTDLRQADLLSADQLFEMFHHPGLVKDFSDGRPMVVAKEVSQGIGLPPRVEFAEPVPTETAAGRIVVKVKATDRGGGVSEVRIFVNGKRVDLAADAGTGMSLDAGRLEVAREVELVAGDNVVVAEGYNLLGKVRGQRVRAHVTRR